MLLDNSTTEYFKINKILEIKIYLTVAAEATRAVEENERSTPSMSVTIQSITTYA
jgi:hypothetical protein